LLHPLQGAGAVGGAHENPLAADLIGRAFRRRVTQIEAVQLFAAALAGQQTVVPPASVLADAEQLVEIVEHLNGFRARLQRGRHGGGGAQHVDDDGASGHVEIEATLAGLSCSNPGLDRGCDKRRFPWWLFWWVTMWRGLLVWGGLAEQLSACFFYKVNPGQCKVPYIGHG
jgi:hypothetical protein